MVSVIDAHLHVVSADTDRYPLQPGGFGRDWWTGRSVDVAQIGRDLDAAGVDRGVIVQAVGPYRNDNRYARAAVAGDPDRFALVGAIDAGRSRSRRRARRAGRRRWCRGRSGVRRGWGRELADRRPGRGDLGGRRRHRGRPSSPRSSPTTSTRSAPWCPGSPVWWSPSTTSPSPISRVARPIRRPVRSSPWPRCRRCI